MKKMLSFDSNNTLSELSRKVVRSRHCKTKRNKRASSSIRIDYQSLEPRKLLASLVGDYVDDFNSGSDSNWEYYWNSAGSLTEPNSFEALSLWDIPGSSIELFTPGGTAPSASAVVNGSSANSLYLGPGIGHPGGVDAVDRYAIAGFTIDQSGYYSIEDSFVSVNNSNSDGIEFKVFVDSGPLLNEGTVNAVGDSKSYFDTELGFLAAGSEIFVAFGAGATDENDAFSNDYSIFRHEEREITFDPTQDSSGTTWEYVVEHSGLYGVRDTATNVSVNDVVISNGDDSLGYLRQGDSITAVDGFEVVRVVPRAVPDLSFVQDGADHFVIDVALPDDNVSADAFNKINAAILHARFIRGMQVDDTESDGIERSVEIKLSPGTYRLDSTDSTNGHFFQLFDDDNLVINGNGATIIANDATKELFNVSISKNIIIRDLTFDYAEHSSSAAGEFYKPVGFTQGEILGIIGDDTVRIEVDTAEFFTPDRFLPALNPASAGRFWGFPVKQGGNGRIADNVESIYPTSDATLVADNGRYKTFDIAINFRTLSSNEFSVGDTYVMQRRDTPPAFRLTDSDNVTIQRVTAYSAPGLFVVSRGGELNNLLDSHVKIRPTSNEVTSTRVTSINGDAVHVQSDRAGLWIEDSTFNGVSDDVMNFYSLPAAVHSVAAGGSQLTLGEIVGTTEAGFSVRSLYEVGDVLVFVDPTEGTVIAEARITNVEDLRPQARFVVTLDQTVDGITLRGGGNDTMVFNTSINKGFVVQDSELTNSRRFGNFLMANNVDLVDNVYSGLPDQAIAGHSELDFPLGPYAKNVLVQGNEFRDIGFSSQALTRPYYQGAVAFFMDRLGDTTASTGTVSGVPDGVYEIENIQIRDNVFIDWSERAIVVRNAQRVTIADNLIYAPNQTDLNDQDRAFLIENFRDITIENNIFDEDLAPVILGDVNLDGEVTFLDLAPFISVLTSREFQAEADINDDGLVSFLDIQPFIDILNG